MSAYRSLSSIVHRAVGRGAHRTSHTCALWPSRDCTISAVSGSTILMTCCTPTASSPLRQSSALRLRSCARPVIVQGEGGISAFPGAAVFAQDFVRRTSYVGASQVKSSQVMVVCCLCIDLT